MQRYFENEHLDPTIKFYISQGGWLLSQGETVGPHEEDQEAEEKLVAEEGGHLERPLQDQEEQQDTDRGGLLEGDEVCRGRRPSQDFPLTTFVHWPAGASGSNDNKQQQCLNLLCVWTNQQSELGLTRGWWIIWGRLQEIVTKRIQPSGFRRLTIRWSRCSSYCTNAPTIR